MPVSSPSSAVSQRTSLTALLVLALSASVSAQTASKSATTSTAAAKGASGAQIDRGRYLVRTSGCNDCHTPGYGAKAGDVPEKLWLTGDKLGWSGPWGTTYAANLRLMMASMSQDEWLKHARTMTPRPPMPWFNVRAMTDADLKAIYAYTRSLGPAGEPAPAFVPPGTKPSGPVIQFPG